MASKNGALVDRPSAVDRDVPIERITIRPPNFQTIEIPIVGTAPLVLNRFSEKAKKDIEEKARQGRPAASRSKAKTKRDYQADCEAAKYVSDEGWLGIHAASFRNACIDACRAADFKMTHAKLAVFVVADGADVIDETPLVRIYGPKPSMWLTAVRNNTTGGSSLSARPRWKIGWKMRLKIKFDADMFTSDDVVNLVARVGVQVGVGEGRPYSKASAGIGLGTFEIEREG